MGEPSEQRDWLAVPPPALTATLRVTGATAAELVNLLSVEGDTPNTRKFLTGPVPELRLVLEHVQASGLDLKWSGGEVEITTEVHVYAHDHVALEVQR